MSCALKNGGSIVVYALQSGEFPVFSRSISYEVAQLLVNLLDLCARRVAYSIDEPESVQTETTVDEVSGR